MKARLAMSGMLALSCAMAWAVQPAQAQSAREMRDKAESSMQLKGTVDIEPDGSVSAQALDDVEKIPEVVVGLVQETVSRLRFAPLRVDGQPVQARARMELSVVAKPVGDGRSRLSVVRATFDELDLESTTRLRGDGLVPPRYPVDAMRMNGQGIVQVIVKIGPDGKVIDAIVEQVDLTSLGSEGKMAHIRRVLGDAAIEAARKWTFRPPTTGELAGLPYWSLRVPTEFNLGYNPKTVPYGGWKSYIPGPRQQAPWITDENAQGTAGATGGAHLSPSRFRLLTPLPG